MNLRGTQSISFFSYLKEVSQERGFLSLYKGLEAGLVRQIFYATSRFGLFEVIRDKVSQYREVDFASRLFSGVTSGALAALISCPAEVTLVRISNDATLPVDQRRNYSGVVNGFTRIFAEEGMGAFFRGSGPFVNRAMLVGSVQVGTYDQFKSTYRGFGITGTFTNTLCAAMTSGLLYSLVTMPFETAKNAMAFQKPDPASGKMLYNGTIQTISLLAKQGPMKLYNGFLPYYLRCGGHTVSHITTLVCMSVNVCMYVSACVRACVRACALRSGRMF
jgi:solute carrier family 25 oxoglutarate transporter 11